MSSFRRRSNRYVVRSKRNSERHIKAGQINLPDAASTYSGYVWTAPAACTVRSIKLDIGMSAPGSNPIANHAIAYALVVVREGYNANALYYPAIEVDMYNPTMDVLISGVVTDTAVEDHKWNSIGRKFKAGDRMALLVKSTADNAFSIFEISFSVLT